MCRPKKTFSPGRPASTCVRTPGKRPWWMPPLVGKAGDERFSCLPALNMLNLRYVVGRGKPPDLPKFDRILVNRDDYWVFENSDVLPRVFIPSTVRALPEAQTLKLLT